MPPNLSVTGNDTAMQRGAVPIPTLGVERIPNALATQHDGSAALRQRHHHASQVVSFEVPSFVSVATDNGARATRRRQVRVPEADGGTGVVLPFHDRRELHRTTEFDVAAAV